MDDFLRDAGLKYAGHLPEAIGVHVAALSLIGFAIWVVYEGKLDLGDFRTPALVILAILAIFSFVQLPTAYFQAERYCSDLYENSRSVLGTIDLSYTGSKCSTLWPSGPP